MERNTIELMAHTITIADEKTAIKYAVPDPVCTVGIKEVPAFEKNTSQSYTNIPSHKPQRFSAVHNKLKLISIVHVIPTVVGPGSVM
jgi:hypothetical protein